MTDVSEGHVRVRMAPSPTGSPHVGLARTALYNWAFARHHGGTFVFRIEDTDAARNTQESYDGLFEVMGWLGLDWDEGPDVGGPYAPYRQSERSDIYADALARLKESSRTYECYCTNDEVEARRKASGSKIMGYDGHCRDVSEEQVDAFRSEGPNPSCASGCPTVRSPSTTSSAARSPSTPTTRPTSRWRGPTASRSTRWSTRSTTR